MFVKHWSIRANIRLSEKKEKCHNGKRKEIHVGIHMTQRIYSKLKGRNFYDVIFLKKMDQHDNEKGKFNQTIR